MSESNANPPPESEPGSEPNLATVQSATPEMILQAQLQSGASWFYWVAGLSIVNSLIYFFGGSINFIFGLGVTQIVDVIGSELPQAGRLLSLLINGVIAGLFVVIGLFAMKRLVWVMIGGMILYGLDALLLVVLPEKPDFLGIAFHVYVLYCLFRGLQASWSLQQFKGSAPNSFQ